jgi:SagB-type dehydrogenase family enzyme
MVQQRTRQGIVRRKLPVGAIRGLTGLMILTVSLLGIKGAQCEETKNSIKLPAPIPKSSVSIEEALQQRRSVRKYQGEPLSLAEISQLLWAAQGITHSMGFRTAPSAGALFPLEVYVVAGNVEDLTAGIYKYQPSDHELVKIMAGDKRSALRNAALGQSCIEDAPAVMVIAAVYERTERKYGERGVRYAQIEVGCAAENIYLQAVSLNLGTVIIGAFHDDRVKKVLDMPKDEQPLAIMPVGRMQ